MSRKHDDLALTRRKFAEGGVEDRRQGGGIKPIVTLVGPSFEGISPLALGVEAGWIDSVQSFDRRLGCSAEPAERARLTRMLNSQVLNDDRPSKRSIPRTTPSHVS